ncbi:2-oxoglutarate (2OG) and Fe(II)-dependent oxygenase superfamily protein [Melia azedarach]|uniref:2-oxoglutarate (2OG) and Fe(II)-dependent oxygenase superfamily protein n=1 Tax=Melia azedarach TaxID=155640 RepID=A0ACC1XRH2_MELAZ|nr:2-oxoglutarate (2OG) and Fe(II)-dependent oxygenase superfamily protein [Melia azedarach]
MVDHVITANGEEIKVHNLQCIDLSNPDIHESAALLRKAFMESSCFLVINHGISQEFLDGTFAQFKRFFYLPMEEKMKLLSNTPLRGYQSTTHSFIDDKSKQKVHLTEGFRIGVGVSEFEPKAHDFVHGRNMWPPADLLPGWREAMEEYNQKAINAARKIGRIMAVALDLNEDFFDQPELIGGDASYTNIQHYGNHEGDLVGAPPHCDLSLFTLLATDDIWGLQICREKNAESQVWEAVAPVKGAYIVIVGDMLEMLTNGIFRSMLHKVIVDQERYSCLPNCISAENPPKYPTIRTGQYVSDRLGRILSRLAEPKSASTLVKKV